MIAPFKLEQFFTLHEFRTKYLLSSSDCETMSIGELLNFETGANDRFQALPLGYTEKEGSLPLRTEIARLYNGKSEKAVLVCVGAQEPIYIFANTVLNAGDEVIVQAPFYEPVASIPAHIGCKVRPWTVHYRNGIPYFEIAELISLINRRTKAIFINTPHNPTGFHFSEFALLELVKVARQHNIIIFSDEVYKGLEHDRSFKIPAIADLYEHGVSLGVMSKTFGLAGLRIGWVCSPRRDILERMNVLKEYLSICNPAPSDFLAEIALRNKEKIWNRNIEIIRSNIAAFEAFVARHGNLFQWCRPNAGTIGFVKVKSGIDVLTAAEELVKQNNVMLLPGEFFDYPGYFRIGFGRQDFKEGLEELEKFVALNLTQSVKRWLVR